MAKCPSLLTTDTALVPVPDSVKKCFLPKMTGLLYSPSGHSFPDYEPGAGGIVAASFP